MSARILIRLLTLGVVVLASAGPATAKMPPYSCELSTRTPVVGGRVVVEVRFWNDADHTDPARWGDFFGRLRDFVEARAIDRGEPGEYDLGVLHATLRRVVPGVYRGDLVFPDTRRFRIEGCGDGYDRRGYPSRRGIVIRPRPFYAWDPGRSRPASSGETTLVATLMVLGLTATGFVAHRRRMGRVTETTG